MHTALITPTPRATRLISPGECWESMSRRRSARASRRSAVGVGGPVVRGLLPAGMTLWLRADVGVTGNPNVTQWSDQSGNGNHATPPAFSPTLANNMNGRPSIHYVGGGDTLTFASFTAGLTALEIFAVLKNQDDGATSMAPFAFTDDTGAQLVPFAVDRKIYDDTGSTTRQTTNFAAAAGKYNAPYLYNVVSTSTEWSMFFNNGTGTPDFTTATNTFGYGTRRLGKGTTLDFNGDMAEIVLYPAKLSAPNKALAVATLKSWYGIP